MVPSCARVRVRGPHQGGVGMISDDFLGACIAGGAGGRPHVFEHLF